MSTQNETHDTGINSSRYEREKQFLTSLTSITQGRARIKFLREATGEQIKALVEVFLNIPETELLSLQQKRVLNKYRRQIKSILACKDIEKLRKLFIKYQVILKPLLCILLSSLFKTAVESLCGALM